MDGIKIMFRFIFIISIISGAVFLYLKSWLEAIMSFVILLAFFPLWIYSRSRSSHKERYK